MERLQVWLLLMLLAMFSMSSVLCKRYHIPQHWNFNYTGSDQEILSFTYQSSIDTCYSLISNGSMTLVSDNNIFSLALLHTGYLCSENAVNNGKFSPRMLGVMMQKRNDIVPVWTTSLDDYPFGDGSAGFNVIELNDTGDFALLENNTLVWQSSDHPGNILLPGHRLRTGMSLQSKDEYQTVRYVANVSKSGLILYYVTGPRSNVTVPYKVWGIKAGKLSSDFTVDSANQTLCEGYETILTYNGSAILLSYEAVDNNSKSSVHCDDTPPPLKLPLESLGSILPELPYLELDSRGDMVLHKFDEMTGGWVVDSKLSDYIGYCSLPYPCGWRGLCDAKNKSNPCVENPMWHSRPLPHQRTVVLHGVGCFATKYNSSAVKTNRNVNLKDCEPYGFRSVAVYDNYTRDCFQVIPYVCLSLYIDKTTENLTLITWPDNNQLSTVEKSIYIARIIFALLLLLTIVTSTALVMYWTLVHRLVVLFVVTKYTIINLFSKAVRDTEALLSTMQGLPRRYTYMELDKATKGFSTKLGAGGFGSVYEGTTSDGRHVAVKKLVSTGGGAQVTKQFVTEVVGVGGVSHLNIVKLYGFCIEGASRKLLVYEFMPNGSLERWIFGSERTLTLEQRFDIALGTARGLAYLHEECSEPILHLDIKPQNILLDEKFVPKVADFGMAKLLANRDVTQTETGVRGTIGYLAPEWFMRSVATKKCDVYSYGMVLLELIGGRKNVDLAKVKEVDQDGNSDWYFPSWVVNRVKKGEIVQVVDEKLRACADETTDRDHEQVVMKMVRIALWCIQDSPSIRPSMQEIVEMLEGHRAVEEPPMSFHFDADGEHQRVLIDISESEGSLV